MVEESRADLSVPLSLGAHRDLGRMLDSLVLKCSGNKGFEERMRMANCGTVFRMELNAHKPRMIGQLDDFD